MIFWLENLKGGGHLEDLVVDGKIILEWILRKQGREVWIGFIWLRIWTKQSYCEHRKETLGFH
jgi:hypothetical protein